MRSSCRMALTIIFAFASLVRAADPPLAEFKDWAGEHALSFKNVAMQDDQSDLVPLTPLIGEARVVALGESVHVLVKS